MAMMRGLVRGRCDRAVIDEELQGILERMTYRGYTMWSGAHEGWEVSITRTHATSRERRSLRSRVIGWLHWVIYQLAERPEREPLLDEDQFDEMDQIDHLLKRGPIIPASPGSYIVKVGFGPNSEPTLTYDPIIAHIPTGCWTMPIGQSRSLCDVDPCEPVCIIKCHDGTYREVGSTEELTLADVEKALGMDLRRKSYEDFVGQRVANEG